LFVYESFFVILRSKVREYPLLLDAKVIIKMETSKKSGTNIVKNYVRYLKLERNFTANTLEAYQRDLRYLLNFVKSKEMSLLDVKLEDLKEFSASLHDKGVGARSQARVLSGVRAFYRYLVLDDYLKDDPTELLPYPQIGEHLPEYLTVEEVDMLKSAIDLSKWEGQRNKAIIEVLFSCGLRVTELVNLKLSDIFEEEKFIRVFGSPGVALLVYGQECDENQAGRGRLCVSQQKRCSSYPYDDSHHDQECGAGCWHQEDYLSPYLAP